MQRIQTGDTIIVTTGSDKGYVGEVIEVKNDKVRVRGAKLITKHLKDNPQINQKASIVKKESFIHISNVAMYNPEGKKASKVGFKIITSADGKRMKQRYFKSNNEIIT